MADGMGDEELASLGVQVQSVSGFEADVAAAADAAAASAEAADFAKRDDALAADIENASRDLNLARDELRPDRALLRSLERKIETAREKRAALASAHDARQEVVAAEVAVAAATVRKKYDGGDDLGGGGVERAVKRLAAETQREYDIRTGKITPLQKDGEEISGFQRRQRAVFSDPVMRTGKREREKEERPKNSMGSRGEEDSDAQDSGSEFDAGSLADDESNFGSLPGAEDDQDDAEPALDPAEDPEEVVVEGDLTLPASVFDKLFPYQKTGLKWLLELHNQQAGGVLADEMVSFILLPNSVVPCRGLLVKRFVVCPFVVLTARVVLIISLLSCFHRASAKRCKSSHFLLL